MIVLDTHIWIWWVHGDSSLTSDQERSIQEHESDGLGVSIISCWEVAKLVERGRLILPGTGSIKRYRIPAFSCWGSRQRSLRIRLNFHSAFIRTPPIS